MACSRPRFAHLTSEGKVSFSPLTDNVKRFPTPCGKCHLCLSQRKAEAMARLVMEGWSHPFGQSICATLTYADEHLPAGGCLSKRDAQLFAKRLRIELARSGLGPVRLHTVGEYSPKLKRPHYHVIIFGWWPADSVGAGKSRSGRPEYSSALLSDIWGMGRVTFQAFSASAAAYVAKHQASKLRRKGADELAVQEADGSWRWLSPEFELRPLRPGLGALFFEKHREQLLAHGFVVVDGRQVGFPRYFNTLAKRADPDRFAELRELREAAALDPKRIANSTPERLAVREECAVARDRFFSRAGGLDVPY